MGPCNFYLKQKPKDAQLYGACYHEISWFTQKHFYACTFPQTMTAAMLLLLMYPWVGRLRKKKSSNKLRLTLAPWHVLQRNMQSMNNYSAMQMFLVRERNPFELSLFPALYINIALFLSLDYPQFEVCVLTLCWRTVCKRPHSLVCSCSAIETPSGWNGLKSRP